jgi:metallo-beta-lactamase class B
LKKISGARVAVIREDKALFESGGELDFHCGSFKEYEFEPTKVDLVFSDGDVIKLGDVAITAILTNGHTKGSTSFVTHVVDDGKVYTIAFPNGTTVNPGYRLVKDPSYPGIADDFRRTLHRLEMLRPDVWLGLHTDWWDPEGKRRRAATEGVSAFVDPEGYRRWVAREREEFEAALNRELGVTVKPK